MGLYITFATLPFLPFVGLADLSSVALFWFCPVALLFKLLFLSVPDF